MMRLIDGSRVEVFRKKKKYYGSWFPAKVLMKTGNMYIVRYDHGEPAVKERVKEEHIRPHPPLAGEGETWVLGDVAEVFDVDSWRAGKIAKVLDSNYVVIRLFGSIQLKRFHISNLRVRQVWQNNQWIMLGKISEEKNAFNSFKHATPSNVVAVAVKCEKASSRQKFEPDNICSSPHKQTVSQKRKCTTAMDKYSPPTKRGTPREVDAFIFSNDLVGNNSTQHVSEEDIECSVASCSGNNYIIQNSKTGGRGILGDFSDDTLSSSPHKTDIHVLELHAYKSTLLALYASGPLSWEQESLLTNLRMSLHISSEEHLLQLRNLLST